MKLVSELKRRNVLRMAALYAVASWLIMQVVGVLIDLINLPDFIGVITLWLIAVGFPIALVFSWFYEITPEGISLEKSVDSEVSISQVTGRRLDFIVISLLLAAVILFAFDKWWAQGPPEKSIAVMPFVNMSGDPDQEYFSDGISEEVLNLLAKIPDLRVISRSSAFSYKGKAINVSDIAQELNVGHILEGSVRKAGDRVRITVQLIDARLDTHLWSETYDRMLSDIFATQDEIATEVVTKLEITLLGSAPSVEETDPQAFSLRLQGDHVGRQSTAESYVLSNELYERALAIDPEYVQAMVHLAINYCNQANWGLRPPQEAFASARELLKRALTLDPRNAGAYAMLGWIAMKYDSDLSEAAGYFERALEIEPYNHGIIAIAAAFSHSIGRFEEGVALEEFKVSRDPANPVSHANLALGYMTVARWDEAIASYRIALQLSPGFHGANYGIGKALLLKGDANNAEIAMLQETSESYRLGGLAIVYATLKNDVASDEALTELINMFETSDAYNIAYVFSYRGEVDRAFEWLEKAVEYNDPGLSEIAGEVLFSRLHDDPRWLPFLSTVGKSPTQLAVVDFNVDIPEPAP